jgi:hypothetical protein
LWLLHWEEILHDVVYFSSKELWIIGN